MGIRIQTWNFVSYRWYIKKITIKIFLYDFKLFSLFYEDIILKLFQNNDFWLNLTQNINFFCAFCTRYYVPVKRNPQIQPLQREYSPLDKIIESSRRVFAMGWSWNPGTAANTHLEQREEYLIKCYFHITSNNLDGVQVSEEQITRMPLMESVKIVVALQGKSGKDEGRRILRKLCLL